MFLENDDQPIGQAASPGPWSVAAALSFGRGRLAVTSWWLDLTMVALGICHGNLSWDLMGHLWNLSES
jgi:hypothetical protein